MFNDWDEKAENSNAFVKALASAIKQFNKGKVGMETCKVTAVSPDSFETDSSMENGFEVIVYPEHIAYTGMKLEHIQEFVEKQLGEGKV